MACYAKANVSVGPSFSLQSWWSSRHGGGLETRAGLAQQCERDDEPFMRVPAALRVARAASRPLVQVSKAAAETAPASSSLSALAVFK